MKNIKSFIGLGIIIIVITAIGGYQVYNTFIKDADNENGEAVSSEDIKELEGYLGWEKKGFFFDEEVKTILRDEYGIIANNSKKGSIEMVSEPVGEDVDYLFPSSKIALEIYKDTTGTDVSSETIFYSPIVIYSWRSLLPELEKSKLVKQEGNTYILNLEELIKLVMEGKTWEDIGVTSLRGNITVSSTDPTKSNSGNMFSALVANMLNNKNGQVVTDSGLTPELKAQIKSFFDKMGLMDSSSGDIFDKFLNIGKGTYPFVVGYESQLIEVINQGRLNVDDIVTLYPNPTVWSEHEFIPLNDDANKLMRSLSDNERLSKIGWERYGFRKIGANVDEDLYKDKNIAKDINYTTPVPKASVMQEIIKYLEEN